MDEGIADRLRLALTRLGITMSDVSKKCGLPYRSLQNYASGKQNPGAEALIKIKSAMGISTDWLLTGEGEMMNQDVQVTPQRDLTIDDYRELRAKFSNFDDVFQLKDLPAAPGRRDNSNMSSRFIDRRAAAWRIFAQLHALNPDFAFGLLGDKKFEEMTDDEVDELHDRLFHTQAELLGRGIM